ncbi:hypothetical protein ACFPRL_26285 [Pseudoclavibacter helvolus]
MRPFAVHKRIHVIAEHDLDAPDLSRHPRLIDGERQDLVDGNELGMRERVARLQPR